MRVAASGSRFSSRWLISPSQRRWASRASVLANSGIGGALLWTAELNAVRTESIRGSSTCAPARAGVGSVSSQGATAATAAPPRHWRRDSRRLIVASRAVAR